MVKFSSRDGNDIPPFLGGNNMEQWYHSPTWWKLGRCCIDFAGLPGSGYPIYPTGEVWCRKNHLRCILPSPPSNMQLSWDVKPRTKITFKTAFIWEGWHWKARKSTRQGTHIFLLEEYFQPKRGVSPKSTFPDTFWAHATSPTPPTSWRHILWCFHTGECYLPSVWTCTGTHQTVPTNHLKWGQTTSCLSSNDQLLPSALQVFTLDTGLLCLFKQPRESVLAHRASISW